MSQTHDRAMSLEGNFASEIKRFLPAKWTESLLTMVNSITPDGPVQNFTSDLHSNEVKANAAQSERITSELIWQAERHSIDASVIRSSYGIAQIFDPHPYPTSDWQQHHMQSSNVDAVNATIFCVEIFRSQCPKS